MRDTGGIELKAFKHADKTLKLQNLPKALAQNTSKYKVLVPNACSSIPNAKPSQLKLYKALRHELYCSQNSCPATLWL